LGLSTSLITEWNLFRVSLGIKILILNSIGEKIIINSHWFMKDEEAIDWRESFQYFHWTRGTSLRRGQRSLLRRRSSCVFFSKEEEENECEREELVLMCEKMLFMEKKLCANKEHGRKLCV
jgi:hypothetical protein